MTVDQDVYRLTITPPKLDDSGKYTCEIGGITTSCYLTVEGNWKFNQLLEQGLEWMNVTIKSINE